MADSRRKARSENSRLLFSSYFSLSAAGLGFVFSAGLAAFARTCRDARSARVLCRLAACERLRVFLRALALDLGMKSSSPHSQDRNSVLTNLPRRHRDTEKSLKESPTSL